MYTRTKGMREAVREISVRGHSTFEQELSIIAKHVGPEFDALIDEIRRQSLEAWMRGDYQTADRLAALVGDPLPSEHEKEGV